jgi:hypothetical protein
MSDNCDNFDWDTFFLGDAVEGEAEQNRSPAASDYGNVSRPLKPTRTALALTTAVQL